MVEIYLQLEWTLQTHPTIKEEAMHIVNEIKKDDESTPFVHLVIVTWAGFYVMGQEVPLCNSL